MFRLDTERLYLREMTAEDAENAYYLNLDPEVVKYTGDVAFESIEAAREFLKKYTHYKEYGFGRWAVIDKSNDEYLGWCGIKYSPDLDEFDIGYRFAKKHWGKGYATESAKACLEYAFNTLNIKVLVGRAMTENIDSIKVLEKLGMKFFEDRTCGNENGVVYIIENKL